VSVGVKVIINMGPLRRESKKGGERPEKVRITIREYFEKGLVCAAPP